MRALNIDLDDLDRPAHKRRREPVLVGVLGSLILAAAVKIGLPVDQATADVLAGLIVTVGAAWARSKVTPVD